MRCDVPNKSLDEICVNTLRFLSADAVQKANSGHPGLPLGAAAPAYCLWDRFLKFNPGNPVWPDRDRFILSAGHGSALLYALLHLTGFDLPLDEIQNFRQWNSRTPGHPEYGMTPGVEATTGPLGQGIGNAVGMAIAETALAARFNRPDSTVVDHYTFVLCGDGDLMEGIASEAASLAGHLKLGKLIVLYDSNRITIEGNTDLSFTEDTVGRFRAFGWHTLQVENGNDLDSVAVAIEQARQERQRPSLIEIKTHIGYGSPNKQDSASAHGEPLGEEELRLTKKNLGWPEDKPFYIPDDARAHFRQAIERGRKHQEDWDIRFRAYAAQYPQAAAEFRRAVQGELPDHWDRDLPGFDSAEGELATRSVSGKVLNSLAQYLPELIGGSADLAPSNKTLIAGSGDFSSSDRMGRNLRFGIREHAMGAIINGIALHRGFIPYCGTFLIFSDYMRPAIRLAALSSLPVIYVFTHDSIAVGEDGPTHQPVEQLLSLRAIPDLVVMRPADANETVASWRFAIEHRNRPVALILSRQKLPVLEKSRYPQLADCVSKGGYIVADTDENSELDIIVVATGSEVHLALDAREELAHENINVRVVSFPSWILFEEQSDAYRESVLPSGVPILAIEAGRSLGWKSYVGPSVSVIGIDCFGLSAPGKVVLNKYGFNLENVCDRARKLAKCRV
ncbi:MAG: transketolase [Candidatus Zixiibacteriota bacterium]|nr:MAG: transketolase [candidate division Zixibacteria bacterium]